MKPVNKLLFLSILILSYEFSFGQVKINPDAGIKTFVIDSVPTEGDVAKSNYFIPGRYIVVLKEDETTQTFGTKSYVERQQLMQQKVKAVVDFHNISSNKVGHVYCSSIIGFTIEHLNDEEVEKLQQDGRVKYIEQDQRISQPIQGKTSPISSPPPSDCSFLKVNGLAFENGSATFGASSFTVSGELDLANDGIIPVTDACQALQNPVTGKVVLIDRGVCEFGFKALQAQNGGAIAVIIANNEPGSIGLMGGGADGGQVTIPVISVSLADGDSIKAMIAQGVTTVELDNQLTTQCTPWGVTRVNGGTSGAGKRAWVIDTGVDTLHPDLNVNTSLSATFATGTTSPQDENGHGTHVSGTIAALDNAFGVIGVASGAEVIAVRVFDATGEGTYADIIAGVNYVAGNASGDDVANLSLGGPVSTAMDDAVIAASAICKFVLSAGNDSQDANNASPARVNGSNIFTVSAMDIHNQFASFSNYGNPPIDYCQPGVNVLSCALNGSYAYNNGTSMAAPHLTGLLLLGDLCAANYVNGDPDDTPDPIATYDDGSLTDVDGDGYNICVDCDDSDSTRHPGAVEICDGIDNDCDGIIDNGNVCCTGSHILYVNTLATGVNSGADWTNAFTDLQSALKSSCPNVTEIWVAAGIYKPTSGLDPYVSFILKNGVSLYGGFPGVPGQENNFVVRDPKIYQTILDGDLLNDDTPNFGNWDDNSAVLVQADSLDSSTVMDGFTIRNGGFGTNAGGMDVLHSEMTLSNLIFQNNQSTEGGALFITSGHPIVQNCLFYRNYAISEGGAVKIVAGNATIDRCSFIGNKSVLGGAFLFFNNSITDVRELQITNTVFEDNLAEDSGGALHLVGYEGGSLAIINCRFNNNKSLGTNSFSGGGHISGFASLIDVMNCTFANGYATQEGGAILLNNHIITASVRAVNSVFANNSASVNHDHISAATPDSSSLDYCLFDLPCPAGIACQSTITDADTVFADVALGDLRLWPCSPAIDAGTDVGAPLLDMTGASRVDVIPGGGLVDMGAYEFQGPFGDIDLDGDGYTICEGDCDDDNIAIHPGATEVCDGIDNNCDGRIDENRVCCPSLVQNTVYVNAAATGLNDGSSWANAYIDLQDALTNECVTDIWVAAGIYRPSSVGDRNATFHLRKEIRMLGGFPATGNPGIPDRDWNLFPTILSGDLMQDDKQHPLVTNASTNSGFFDNSITVVTASDVDSTTVLDGFIITAGVSSELNATGQDPLKSGGGMYVNYGAPKLINCSISGNYAIDGGGVFSRDSLGFNISNCVFQGNLASGGGGLYILGGDYQFTNCQFNQNQANYGGGLHAFFSANIIMNNCSLFENVATIDGGGIRSAFSSSLSMNTCQFNQNSAQSSAGISNLENSSFDLTDCSFVYNNASNGAGLINNSSAVSSIYNCNFEYNSVLNSGAGLVNNGSNLTIEKSIFKNNVGVNGVGITISNAVLNIKNCVFENNVASNWGGGLLAENGASIYVDRSTFKGNSALFGGGYFNRAGAHITNCKFVDNIIFGEGGGAALCNYQISASSITNTVFHRNQCTNEVSNGGAVLNQIASPTYLNCTFSENSANVAGMMVNHDVNDNPRLINCIVFGNYSTTGESILNLNGSTSTLSYTLLEQDTCPIGANCTAGMLLGQDPQFISDENLHVVSCSPIIDAGLDSVNVTVVDADSNMRKVDAIAGGQMIDLGAYERQAALTANRLYVNGNLPDSKEGTSWNDAFNNLQEAMTYSCPGINEIWVAAGTYKPTEGTNRWASFDMKNNLSIYGGFEGNEGPGYNLELRNFQLNTSILSGEIGDPDSTDNSYTVVVAVNADSTAQLDGFTITGANGNHDYGFPSDPGRGGGVHLNGGNPILTNLVFDKNTALFGGGLYLLNSRPQIAHCIFFENRQTFGGYGGGGIMSEGNSGPIIHACSFDHNHGFFGGGVYLSGGNPQMENCLFTNNTALFGGGVANVGGTTARIVNCVVRDNVAAVYGGGVANYASASLINCTIAGNESSNLGGGVYNGSDAPVLTNCIVWGNSAGIEGVNTSVVTYSIVQGGHAGAGNQNTDPLFVDSIDLRPMPCSPAIDLGDNAANTLLSDFSGNPRIFNATGISTATIDLGAYEMPTDNTLPTIWTGFGDGVLWTDGQNWSDGFFPQHCRDVIIPFGTVTVPPAHEALGKTLEVQTGADLETLSNAQMEIGE